jgi:hypothetical protein
MEALQVKKDRSLVQQWLAAEGRYAIAVGELEAWGRVQGAAPAGIPGARLMLQGQREALRRAVCTTRDTARNILKKGMRGTLMARRLLGAAQKLTVTGPPLGCVTAAIAGNDAEGRMSGTTKRAAVCRPVASPLYLRWPTVAGDTTQSAASRSLSAEECVSSADNSADYEHAESKTI